jgi:hypothetical protein
VFYYTAAYWKKNGVLVGTFQINVKRPFTLLSIGKTINGVRVQFSNNPDRILMNFDCTRPSNKNSKYRVSTDAYPQFASRDELAGALTVACAEFQNAVRETQKTQQMKQAGNGGA